MDTTQYDARNVKVSGNGHVRPRRNSTGNDPALSLACYIVGCLTAADVIPFDLDDKATSMERIETAIAIIARSIRPVTEKLDDWPDLPIYHHE